MSILDALQAKVNAVDSSTAMSEILQLMYNVKDHPYKNQYDSAGLMPLDSAFIGSMAYAENRNAMYMLVGIDSGWKLIDSDAATAVAPSGPSAMTQGSNYGYLAGSGYGPPSNTDVIQKYSFTSDANSTDVGNLTVAQGGAGGGASSPSDGYYYGGTATGSPYPSQIEIYAFPSDGNATDAGDLATSFDFGASSYDGTHGYHAGGRDQSGGHPSYKLNAISRFPLASSGISGSDVGDLFDYTRYNAGNSSSTHGYSFGGQLTSPNPTTDHTRIEKFLFAASANATDVGDMSDVPGSSNGYLYATNNLQSDTHGYTAGGWRRGPPNVVSEEIQKWPFATDTNASDVGDLVTNPESIPGGLQDVGGGTSSTTHGYVAGGHGQTSGNGVNIIQKFTFASDANATDVGDLLAATYIGGSGAQY